MAPAKRVSLSIGTKMKIIAEVDRKVKTKTEIAREFNLSSSFLSTILKNREKIFKSDAKFVKSRMRSRDAKWPALENALVQWIKTMRSKNVPVDGKLLRAKADDFALQMNIEGFHMSEGWLSRFKERHGLAFRKLCGESASVDNSACEEWKYGRLKVLLEKYSPADIFNADETGLMYKLLPDRSLVFKNETSAGGKKAKARLTVLLAANMSGTEKLPLLIIGKYRNPRCFKGIKTLPVTYKSNQKAWMTSNIFESWIKELDQLMVRKHRKIVLIVDNCTAHPAMPDLQAVQLEFLPPNVTSILQPMDQGVIQCFKKNYRRMLLNRIVACLESEKEYEVTVLSAMHMAKYSWDSVSQETISNCFRHAGFSTEPPNPAIPDPSSADQALVEKLRLNYPVPDCVTFENYADIDNGIKCVEEKTDEEMVNEALQATCSIPEELSSDDEEPKPLPTIQQAVDAAQILRSFFEGRENTQTFLQNVMELENGVLALGNQKQSRITDFFKL